MITTLFLSPAMLTWLLLLFAPTALSVKIYLCGDSTMAMSPNGIIYGWGGEIPAFINTTVVNRAVGGRSARSFTVEGKFKEVLGLVTAGDIVVVEFGHNDGGSLKPVDNGRTACPGAGSETCNSTYLGASVIVKTFPTYLTEAGKAFAAKGAEVVFSSMTPNNIWEDGTGAYTPSRFTDYARQSAKAVGNGSTFVDHGLYTAKAFQALGATKVNAIYPQDHTHTNQAGAVIVAEAFAQAVACAKDPNLLPFMNSKEPNSAC